MKLKFVKGSAKIKYKDGLELNGFLDCDDMLTMGHFYSKCTIHNDKKVIKRERVIEIVKQEKWYLHIPILIHEFCHYLIDCIFPYKSQESFIGKAINPKHDLVERYVDISKFLKIKERGDYKCIN